MIAQRRAFFRTHKNPVARRAFVRRQRAKLRALARAASCRVVTAGAHIVATIPVGGTGGVGVGDGSVWVIDRSTGLARIDPATNAVAETIAGVVGGAPVVGEGAVWVPSGTPAYNRLLRVDPRTRSFVRLATGPTADEWPATAALTPGAVWVGNHHGRTIVRVDPRTNAVVATIPWSEEVYGGVFHMATDGSSVWATGTRATDAVEIDPPTNAIVRRIPISNGTCGGLDVDAASVWVASGYDQPYPCWQRQNWGVSRIARATGAVTRIDVGGRPFGVRVAFGSVWALLDEPQLQLVRIDPASNNVVGRLTLVDAQCRPAVPAYDASCPGAEYTTAIAAGFGSLWVRIDGSAGLPGEVLRIDPSS
jgi:hypothetical protein